MLQFKSLSPSFNADDILAEIDDEMQGKKAPTINQATSPSFNADDILAEIDDEMQDDGRTRYRTKLEPAEEKRFQSWYKSQAKKLNIDPNPDDPLHKYDYRGAWNAGFEPDPINGHWPSQFKDDNHPNRFVSEDGRIVDTKPSVKPDLIERKPGEIAFTGAERKRKEPDYSNELAKEILGDAYPSTGNLKKVSPTAYYVKNALTRGTGQVGSIVGGVAQAAAVEAKEKLNLPGSDTLYNVGKNIAESAEETSSDPEFAKSREWTPLTEGGFWEMLESPVDWFVDNGVEQTPLMAAFIAANAVGALPATLLFSAATQAGSTFRDAKLSGQSDRAAKDAAVQDAVSQIPIAILTQYLPGKLAKRAKTVPQKLGVGGVDTAMEGVEEGVQSVSSQYAQGKDVDYAQAAEEGLVGLVASGPMRAAGLAGTRKEIDIEAKLKAEGAIPLLNAIKTAFATGDSKILDGFEEQYPQHTDIIDGVRKELENVKGKIIPVSDPSGFSFNESITKIHTAASEADVNAEMAKVPAELPPMQRLPLEEVAAKRIEALKRIAAQQAVKPAEPTSQTAPEEKPSPAAPVAATQPTQQVPTPAKTPEPDIRSLLVRLETLSPVVGGTIYDGETGRPFKIETISGRGPIIATALDDGESKTFSARSFVRRPPVPTVEPVQTPKETLQEDPALKVIDGVLEQIKNAKTIDEVVSAYEQSPVDTDRELLQTAATKRIDEIERAGKPSSVEVLVNIRNAKTVDEVNEWASRAPTSVNRETLNGEVQKRIAQLSPQPPVLQSTALAPELNADQQGQGAQPEPPKAAPTKDDGLSRAMEILKAKPKADAAYLGKVMKIGKKRSASLLRMAKEQLAQANMSPEDLKNPAEKKVSQKRNSIANLIRAMGGVHNDYARELGEPKYIKARIKSGVLRRKDEGGKAPSEIAERLFNEHPELGISDGQQVIDLLINGQQALYGQIPKAEDEYSKMLREEESRRGPGELQPPRPFGQEPAENQAQRKPLELPDDPPFDIDERAEKNLVAMHNLSGENLIFADELGGIAAPGIAVTKKDIPFDSFGEITLIGNKDLVDPGRGVDAFDQDAYTPRFPRRRWGKVRTSVAQKFVDRFKGVLDGQTDRLNDQVWDGMVNSPDRDKVESELRRSTIAKALFLKENKGIKISEVKKPNEIQGFYGWVAMPSFSKWLDALKNPDFELNGNDPELVGDVKNAIREYVETRNADSGQEIKKILIDSLASEWITPDGRLKRGIDSAVYKYREVLREPVVYDRAATEKVVDGYFDSATTKEFNSWIKTSLDGIFPDPHILIGKKKYPVTLSNIIAAMRAGGIKGKENTLTHGPAKARAAASDQFSNIDMMHEYKGRLKSEDDVRNYIDTVQDAAIKAFQDEIVGKYIHKDWRGNVDTLNALDATMMSLSDYLRGGKVRQSPERMRKALSKNGFKGVDSGDVELAIKAAEVLRDTPTQYFEAKNMRGVRIGEFSGAVVPTDADEKVFDILKSWGVATKTYDKSIKGDRQRAVQELRDAVVSKEHQVYFDVELREDAPQTEPNIPNLFRDENGEPVVLYHGTTNVFTVPDPDRGNMEGALGQKSIYLTSSPEDASQNYANIEGPDLTAKIAQLKDKILDNKENYLDDFFNYLELDISEDNIDDITDDQAEELAAAMLSEGKSNIMPVYVSMKNPFDMRPGALILTAEEDLDVDSYMDQAREELGEDVDEDEVREFATDLARENSNGEFSGPLSDFLETYKDLAYGYEVDGDIDEIVINFLIDGSASAYELYGALAELDIGDMDTGEYVAHELFRQAVEKSGYDGIIMDAYDSFGKLMKFVAPGTIHIGVFDPRQIKSSTGNVGSYGQRPVTEAEAARLGMSADDANELQGRGDIRFDAEERGDQKPVSDTAPKVMPDEVQAALARAIQLANERIKTLVGVDKRTHSILKYAKGVIGEFESGAITLEQYVTRIDLMQSALEMQSGDSDFRAPTLDERGANALRQALFAAGKMDWIREEGSRLAEWFIEKNPALLKEAKIEFIDQKDMEHSGAGSAFYDRVNKVLNLIKGRAADTSALHEMLHHLELLMPDDMRGAVRRSYLTSLGKAIKNAKTDAEKKYFHLINANQGATPEEKKALFEQIAAMLKSGTVPMSYYKYLNSSEFWAVSATGILQSRYLARNSKMASAALWVREFVEKAKGVVSESSNAPILNTIDDLMSRSEGDIEIDAGLSDEDGAMLDMAERATDIHPTENVTIEYYRDLKTSGADVPHSLLKAASDYEKVQQKAAAILQRIVDKDTKGGSFGQKVKRAKGNKVYFRYAGDKGLVFKAKQSLENQVRRHVTTFVVVPSEHVFKGGIPIESKNRSRIVGIYEKIDALVEKYKDDIHTAQGWEKFTSEVAGGGYKIVAPENLLRHLAQPEVFFEERAKWPTSAKSQAQIGIDSAERHRGNWSGGAYKDTDAVRSLPLLALWNMLSRKISPFPQEVSFLQLMHGHAGTNIVDFLEKSFDGKFSQVEFEKWLKDYGDSIKEKTPGGLWVFNNSAKDWGKTTLPFWNKRIDDGTMVGDNVVAAMKKEGQTGRNLRRYVMELAEGDKFGLDLKVLSFMLFGQGFLDINIIDRVRTDHDFNAAAHAQEWQLPMVKGANADAGISESLYAWSNLGPKYYSGLRGIALYEAIETALQDRVVPVYEKNGLKGSPGRYHWELWNAMSSQDADHNTLNAIDRMLLGVPTKGAIAGVLARQGKFTAQHNMRYGYVDDSVGFAYVVVDANNTPYILETKQQSKDYIDEITKAFIETAKANSENTDRPFTDLETYDDAIHDRIIKKVGGVATSWPADRSHSGVADGVTRVRLSDGENVLMDINNRADEAQSLSGNWPKDAGSGVRTLAATVLGSLGKKKAVNLSGLKVRSIKDVAVAAEVFRDPRVETLRIIYMKGSKIVSHEGISSRMPNMAPSFLVGKKYFQPGAMKYGGVSQEAYKIKNRMERMGADGYYLLHNHPSGEPFPSEQDVMMTQNFARRVPGFKGHVIINSGKFSVVGDGSMRTQDMPSFAPLTSDVPEKYKDIFGVVIKDDTHVALVGAAMKTPSDFVSLIYVNQKNVIRAIQEMPKNLFLQTKEGGDFIRGQARQFGAAQVFAYYTEKDSGVENAFMDHVSGGVLVDGISSAYDSLMSAVRSGTHPVDDYVLGVPDDKILAGSIRNVRFDIDERQTGTPEFKKWFGGSKIVDTDGKPKVVFHGGRRFNRFDITAPPSTHRTPYFWFTDSRENASFYDDGEVKSVFISMKNPAIVDGSADEYKKLTPKEIADIFYIQNFQEDTDWDGVVIENVTDGSRESTVYAVFPDEEGTTSQVKSATRNRGTFDSNDPDIRHDIEERGGEVVSRPAYAPVTYSALRKVIEDKMPKSMPSQDVLNLIKKTPGVKPEEIEFTGLGEWVASREGKVSKQELLDYLEENQVKVAVVERSEPVVIGWQVRDDNNVYPSKLFPAYEEAAEYVRKSIETYKADQVDAYGIMNDDGKWILYRNATGQHLNISDSEEQAEDYKRALQESNVQRFTEKMQIREAKSKGGADVKYPNHVLPGAKKGSYRELILTAQMPLIRTPGVSTVKVEKVGDWWEVSEYSPQGTFSGQTGMYRTREEADRAARNHEKEFIYNKESFKSSHFPEKDILVHVRLNERIDEDGKKVLFIEEIQSDWGQVGRDYRGQEVDKLVAGGMPEDEAEASVPKYAGFSTKQDVTAAQKLRDEALEAAEKLIDITTRASREWKMLQNLEKKYPDTLTRPEKAKDLIDLYTGALPFNGMSPSDIVGDGLTVDWAVDFVEKAGGDKSEARRLGSIAVNSHRRYMELSGKAQWSSSTPRVPDAPFVKDPNKYTELALKHILRYAAEIGSDRVAWTTGEQQVDRYTSETRKRIDSIEWTRGTQMQKPVVRVKGIKDGQVVYTSLFKPDGSPFNGAHRMSQVLGRNIANQITSSKDLKGTIEGDALTVGGNGLIRYYNEVIPNVLKQYVKKLDKAHQGVKTIGVVMNPEYTLSDFSEQPTEQTRQLLREGGEVLDYQAIEITDPLRDVLLNQGQPLFDVETRQLELPLEDRKTLPGTPEFKEWFKQSKIVGRNKKPLVVYHGTISPEDFDVFSEIPIDEKTGEPLLVPSGDPNAYMGTHFTSSAKVASNIAEGRGAEWAGIRTDALGENQSVGPRVIPVFLSIQNPKTFKSESEFKDFIFSHSLVNIDNFMSVLPQPDNEETFYENYDKSPGSINEDIFDSWYMIENDELREEFYRELGEAARADLIQQGFDGVIYRNDVEGGGDSYITFDPVQIKSATGNRGTFSTRDDRYDYDISERPEFKAAFANTKAVDGQGKPKVMYHGTAKTFTVFGETNLGLSPVGWNYFSDSPRFAEKFAVSDVPIPVEPGEYIEVRYASPDGTIKKTNGIDVGVPGLAIAITKGDNGTTYYSVTHTSSGYAVAKMGDLVEAQAIARELSAVKMDWTVGLEEMRTLPPKTQVNISAAIRRGRENSQFSGAGFGYKSSDELGVGSQIMPVYLNVKNPVDLRSLPAKNVSPKRLATALADYGITLTPTDLPFAGRDLYQMLNEETVAAKIRQQAARLGYDGIAFKDYYDNKTRGTSWITFYPEQTKSAFGNVGPYGQRPPTQAEAELLGMTIGQAEAAQARGDIRLDINERSRMPKWYHSALRKAIEDKMPKAMSANEALNLARKTPGVKLEEIQYTGFERFLKSKDRVTKEEVLAFLDENQVRIHVITKLEEDAWRDENIDDIHAEAERLAIEAADNMDFGAYSSVYRVAEVDDGEGWEVVDGDGNSTGDLFDTEDEAQGRADELTVQGQGDAEDEARWEWVLENTGEFYREAEEHLADNQVQLYGPGGSYEMFMKDHSDGSYKEILFQLGIGDERMKNEVYNDRFASGHWDERDVVVHLRIDERMGINNQVDKDAKHVLFIEEIQSDWGQEVRDVRAREVRRVMKDQGIKKAEAETLVPKGFGVRQGSYAQLTQDREEAQRKTFRLYEDLRNAAFERYYETLMSEGDKFGFDAIASRLPGFTPDRSETMKRQVAKLKFINDFPGSSADADLPTSNGRTQMSEKLVPLLGEDHPLMKEYIDARKEWKRLNSELGKMPDAPFIRDTNKYTELAVKYVMSLLGGYSYRHAKYISWTTGLQQVDRYEEATRSRIDAIDATRQTDGGYYVEAMNERKVVWSGHFDGDGMSKRPVQGEDRYLDELFGKDIAEKILNQEGYTDGKTRIEGDDLTIGGRGMQSFYDELLPNIISKLAKKLDPSHPGIVSIWVDGANDDEFQQAIEITDAMREKASKETQPLFDIEERLPYALPGTVRSAKDQLAINYTRGKVAGPMPKGSAPDGKLRVLSLFDGLGGARVALNNIGADVEYYSSEIDRFSQAVHKNNWPDTKFVGDVTKLKASDIPKIDLLVGGSPCQDLSVAKKGRQGLEGKSSGLFYEYVRMLKEAKPKWFVFENVGSMKAAVKDEITSILGVEPILIDAGSVSTQRRPRYFWTNIGTPKIVPVDLKLSDVLESSVDQSLLLSDAELVYMDRRVKGGRNHWEFAHHADASKDKSPTLVANLSRGVPYDVVIDKNGVKRKFAPSEVERLAGLPVGYTEGVSRTQRMKMVGNGFQVQVVESILDGLRDHADPNLKYDIESRTAQGKALESAMLRDDSANSTPPGKKFVPPQKTIKAYKLFRTLKKQPGKIFPLFIGKTTPTPIGEWIPAQNISTKGFASRPGWHAGELPLAPHLMRKDGTMPPDRVWAEIEMPSDVDWQTTADATSTRDIKDQVPEGGHYRFKTNKMQGGAWLIGGAIKVNRILSDTEVAELNKRAQRNDNRKNGVQYDIEEREGIPNQDSFSWKGQQISTGTPVTLAYTHNKESATSIYGKPKKDAQFDRGFEPSGKYVSIIENENYKPNIPQVVVGSVSFKNPLVITHNGYGNQNSWKRTLSAAYGGKRGKALSQAIIADGYDGVITVNSNKEPSETLDLTVFDESIAKYDLEERDPQTETPEFKKWFGDWEKFASKDGGVWSDGKKEVSKAVGKNGKPLILYHGTEKAGFTIFDPQKGNKHRSPMMWFTDAVGTARSYSNSRGEYLIGELTPEQKEEAAEWYLGSEGTWDELDSAEKEEAEQRYRSGLMEDESGYYSVYLNMRNPYEVDFEGANWDGQRSGQYVVENDDNEIQYDKDGRAYFDDEEDARIFAESLGEGFYATEAPDHYETTNSVAEEALKYGHDGAIIRNVLDDGGRGGYATVSDVYVVFNSEQVKSASQNIGTFDPQINDIRYDFEERNDILNQDSFAKTSYKDGNGNDIVWERGNARISVNKLQDATRAVLWIKEIVNGREYWAKRGSINLTEKTLNINGNRDNYLSVSEVGIEKKYRNNGYGTQLYRAILDNANPNIKGIASYTPNRVNNRQIPNIYRRLGSTKDQTGDYDVIFRKEERGQFDVLPRQQSTFSPNDPDIRYDIEDRQTETPEFKNWFGDSKVVDDDGKPIVVYHGTHTDPFVFDRHYATKRFKSDPQRVDAVGTWFTSDQKSSRAYGPKSVPVYLSIRKPLVFQGDELNPQEASKQLWKTIEDAGGADAFRKQAQDEGYDGIIIKDDKLDYQSGDVYIAFDPTQIKSAIGNRGTFDPNDPDIRYDLEERERQTQISLEASGRQAGDDLFYKAVTNQGDLDYAKDQVVKNPDAAFTDVLPVNAKDQIDQEFSSKDFAVAMVLMDQYAQEVRDADAANDDARAVKYRNRQMDIANHVARKLTGAGQLVQAASMIAKLDPKTVMLDAYRRIEKINKALPDGTPAKVLDPAEVERLTKLAESAQMWDALHEDVKSVVDVAKKMRDEIPLTVADRTALIEFTKKIKAALGDEFPFKEKKDGQNKEKALSGWRKILADKADAEAEKAIERLRSRGVVIRSGLPADMMADYMIIGVSKAAHHGLKFQKWASSMVSSFGDDVKPHLKDIYAQVKGEFGSRAAEAKRIYISTEQIDKLIKSWEHPETSPLYLVPSEQAEKIKDSIETVKKMTGDARTEYAQQVAQALNRISDPPGAASMLKTWLRISDLLGTGTFAVNVTSNEILFRTDRLAHIAALPIDWLGSKLKDRDRVIAIKGGADTWSDYILGKRPGGGFWETYTPNLVRGAGLAWKGLSPGELTSAYELDSGVGLAFASMKSDPKWKKRLKKPFEIMERTLSVSLRAPDFAAYSRAYAVVLGNAAEIAWAKRGKASGQTKKAFVSDFIEAADANLMASADAYAKNVTFQDDNLLASAATGTRKAINKLGNAAVTGGKITTDQFGLGDVMMTYARTAVNIAQRSFDYSPFGLLRSLAQMQDVANGDYLKTLNIGRALVGTLGWTMLGAILANAGALKGGEDEEEDILAKEQGGLPAYYLNTSAVSRWMVGRFDVAMLKPRNGDTLLRYNFLEPMGMNLAISAEIGYTLRNEKPPENIGEGLEYLTLFAARMAGAGVQAFVDQPFLQGIAQLIPSKFETREGAVGGALERRAKKIVTDFPARVLTPQFVRQVRRLMDASERETRYDEMTKTAWARVLENVPAVAAFGQNPVAVKTLTGQGDDVPKRYDWNALEWVFNRDVVREYDINRTAAAIMGVYEKTDNDKVLPKSVRYAKMQISIPTLRDYGPKPKEGEEWAKAIWIELTAEDRVELQRHLANATADYIKDAQADLKDQSADEQMETLSGAIDDAWADTKTWFYENRLKDYHSKLTPTKKR